MSKAKLFLVLACAFIAALWQQPHAKAQAASAIIVSSCGTAPFTYTAGQVQPIVQDVNGTLCTAAGGGGSSTIAPSASSSLSLTSTSCGSAVSSCVLKASAGNLYGVYADCTAACWLMVFNSTSAPSNGATTAGNASGNMVECFDISAGSSKSLNYPLYPRSFSVGITAAISSTACATLTLSTVGFVSGSVK